MKAAIVTGSGGLIGAESVRRLVHDGYKVFGVDNDMRARFFGSAGTTLPLSQQLAEQFRGDFSWRRVDIRDEHKIFDLFREARPELVVHCAAQPSHDFAARDPRLDFTVNANGTLNLLEACRRWTKDATFVHCSTSKVYGDNPNRLPLIKTRELDKKCSAQFPYMDGEGELSPSRLDLPPEHVYHNGIDTTMSIDNCLHSLFGVSKASGDLLVQEFGRYFGMPTVCLRPGCLTGGDHAGVELHGFLAYLVRACEQGIKYKIYGYDGLQVRCNIHASDLVSTFLEFHKRPKAGAVYNIGGGRLNACSMLEAIAMAESATGKKLTIEYVPEARIGDHRWWISNNADFENDYPTWRLTRLLPDIVQEIADRCRS